MAIRRILIANRGEIAVRVIRSCRALGIETVLCVSEADRDSLGARMATRAVCIGPSQPAKSYLSVETVVLFNTLSNVRPTVAAPKLTPTMRTSSELKRLTASPLVLSPMPAPP